MRTRKGIWRDRRLLLILWAVVILVASSTPAEELPRLGVEFADKLGHFLEYLVLGMLLLYAFGKRRTLLYGAFFGVADELHQFFVPGRDCSGFDLLADLAGLALSPFVYLLVSYVRKTLSKAKRVS